MSRSHYTQYHAVPTSPEDEVDNPSILELGTFSTRQIDFRVSGPDRNSPFISWDPSCEKPLRLERLVRGEVSLHKSTPLFKLEIKGSKERPPRFYHRLLKPTVQAFKFTIPLPAPASSTFYSMPNDAPCLRGGLFSRDPAIAGEHVGTHGWNRSVDSQSRLQSSASECDKLTKKSWNERMEKMVDAPWLPLSDPSEEKMEKMEKVEAEDPAATLRDCLTAFAEDSTGKFGWLDCRKWILSGRWLIAPQTIYGWDQSVLVEALEGLIQEINEEDPTIKLATGVEVKVKSPRPFFALFYQPDPASLRARFTKICPALLAVIQVVANLLNVLHFGFFTSSFWLPTAALILFSVWFPLFFFGDLSSIHNSIGLAWSMKKWVKTDLPTDLPERRIKEILKGQSDGNGAQDGEDGRGSSHVRLTPDGWERLAGMQEADWIKKHKEKLKAAMRRGKKKGDLSEDEN